MTHQEKLEISQQAIKENIELMKQTTIEGRMEEMKKKLETIAKDMEPWEGMVRGLSFSKVHYQTNVELISKSVGELAQAILLLMEEKGV